MKHCCDVMDYQATENKILVKYEPDARSYRFILHGDRNGTHQSFEYCPWCATKLPEELGEEWGEALEKELGIQDPFIDPGYENLPEEFRTDVWWKKRGL